MKRFFSLILAFLLLSPVNMRNARADALAFGEGGSISAEFVIPAFEAYELNFECDSEVSQLYFVWDEAPGAWTLTALDGSGAGRAYQLGAHGFLHEYIELDSPSAKFRFAFSYGGIYPLQGKAYAFGGGTPPDWVEKWQPPSGKADLLVLPTRYGDEYLYFGGALPYYAANGKNIQAAYFFGADEEIDLHRLLSSLYSMGVQSYPVMARPDNKTADAQGARIAFYAEQIRRFKPDVLLGQAMDETSGVAAAASLSGNAAEYAESAGSYGVWDAPKTYLHGLGHDEIIMDWHTPLEALGGKTSAEAARDAYLGLFPESPNANSAGFIMLKGSNRFGLYRSALGLDVNGGDFFENTAQAVQPYVTADYSGASGLEPEEQAEPPELMQPEGSSFADATVAKPPEPPPIPLPVLGVAAVLCLAAAFLLGLKR